MSPRKRKRRYDGCSIDVTPAGKLRLRFVARLPGGVLHRFSETTTYDDTAANRTSLERQAKLIGAEIRTGRFEYLRWFPDGSKAFAFATAREKSSDRTYPPASRGIAQHYAEWIDWKRSERVRKSRLRDYANHFARYILPALGDTPIEELSLAHLRDLQLALRKRPLAEKTVKNVILGSLKALVRDARRDGYEISVTFSDLEWAEILEDDPDPFDEDERDRLLDYFRRKSWKVGGFDERRPHHAYFAFLFTAFFTGCRPSELAALRVGDVDLARGTLRIRRSRHLGVESTPKTRTANRLVRLTQGNIPVLEPLVGLNSRADDHLFRNVHGEPVDASNFAELFRRAQRALGIRLRKFYATKHTYVSLALTRGVNLAWLSEQTGVAATTLLKHYGKSIHALDADRAEFSKIDGEGGTDPWSAHDDEGKNSTVEVRAAARCLRLDHPACARRRKRA
jgi:integrase